MNSYIITEEDISQFVTGSESLPDGKRKFIEENIARFKVKIEYYEAFQKPLPIEDERELEEKLDGKFFSENRVYILTPTWNNKPNHDNSLKLAAASTKLKKATDSVSFADAEYKYLVRIVTKNGKSLLYILPSDQQQPDQKYQIRILPSENTYELLNLSVPIEIFEETIQQIEITSIR